jgi:hypothetical protein
MAHPGHRKNIIMNPEKEKEYCLAMANTIYQSLFFSLNAPQVGSWGGSDHTACWYKDMPSLRMKVNGMLHKGFVASAMMKVWMYSRSFCWITKCRK